MSEARAGGDRVGGADVRRRGSFEVVVPLHDEASGVDHLVENLDRLALLASGEGFEIGFVLVDDGSTDQTLHRLRRAAAERPGFQVLGCARCRGVGAAMRTGLLHARRGESIVVYDADCTYPVEDVLSLVRGLGACDIVSASPLLDPEGLGRVSAPRRLLTRAAALAYRLALFPHRVEVGLFTCAFRAYRRDIVRAVVPRSDGFSAAAEMLCRALLLDLEVREVPSVLSERRFGHSKLRLARALRGHVLVLLRVVSRRLGSDRDRDRGRGTPGRRPQGVAHSRGIH